MLLLSSCTQDGPTDRSLSAYDDEILFITSMPGIETRSDDDIDNTSIKKGFFVSAGNLEDVTNGIPSVYFSNKYVTPTEGMGNAFRSDQCRWPSNLGSKAGKLRFFGFYPSLETLRDSAGISNDQEHFILEYNLSEDKSKYEYWMKKFKVNENISKHSDFVTAIADGSKTDNLYSGVSMALQHQLSRINIEAFGNSESYDVEIAGIRIGNIATESDFSFEGVPPNDKDWNNTRIGRWIVGTQTKGCVQYIFREGDNVVTIGKGNHETMNTSVSIMGNGGRALVIPYDNDTWNLKNDITNKNQRLYFSVLLRVKERLTENKTLLYPYIEGANLNSSVIVTEDNMKVVYLSVEKSTGKVKHQVYRQPGDKKFYTDQTYSKEYITPENEEIRNYGWASAVPSTNGDPKIRWNPGYQYTYKLNYSKGIGVQDPADALPGRVIISPIEVTGTETNWHTVKDYDNVEIKDGEVNFTIE